MKRVRVRAKAGTRRDVLRGVLAAAVAAALSPLLTGSGPSRTGPYTAGASAGGPTGRLSGVPGGDGSGDGQSTASGDASDDASGDASGRPGRFSNEAAASFDEMYRGCRIRGFKDPMCGTRSVGAARAASAGSWRITVDDRPLHLMRRADGGYLTMIDHYQSYPTPLAAARGTVDELGGTSRLRATAPEAGPGKEHGHGVRT